MKNTSDKRGVVYAIRNRKTNKVYIGSTLGDVKPRWKQHIRKLMARKHSEAMQTDWNATTEEDWQFTVLEADIPNDLRGLVETYWIQRFDSANPEKGYNTVKQYMRRWNSRRARKMEETMGAVVQMLKDGKTYRSIAEETGISVGTVSNIKNEQLPDLQFDRGLLCRADQFAVIDLLKSGVKAFQVASKMGVSEQVISGIKSRLSPELVRHRIESDKLEDVVRLVKSGATYRRVAAATGVSIGTVCSVMKRFQ